MTGDSASLVLRLAGPMQSWGIESQFNRRATFRQPTKGGIIGLLAAAEGRRRADPIEDLLGLSLGVRTDQPGTILRDYHTVSDFRGEPLLSASFDAKRRQARTSPIKETAVTERMYLQDAVFVACISGEASFLASLWDAVLHPAYPLALGRRACVPSQPLVLSPPADEVALERGLWAGDSINVLARVPWQVSGHDKRGSLRGRQIPSLMSLPVTIDDVGGPDVVVDLPRSFDPAHRGFTSRPVIHTSVMVRVPGHEDDANGNEAIGDWANTPHDPFVLLGW